MATKLNDDELVSFKELLMANEVYIEALVQLLMDKGVFSKEELLRKIKEVQRELIQKQSQ
ncbi:MAG: hypothetical protein KQI78_12260 [Deltaproteobacteria bacterium]|nr:hypothetical protein [Deltaproteobacteria bacterium]